MNLDKTRGKTNVLLKTLILLLVGVIIFLLIHLNTQQLKNTKETKNLICDIILSLKHPTDGQKVACDGLGTHQ